MEHMNFPLPGDPNEDAQPQMIYVNTPAVWEYKQVRRDLSSEPPMSVEELNALGKDGWELSAVLAAAPAAYFYFKRLVE